MVLVLDLVLGMGLVLALSMGNRAGCGACAVAENRFTVGERAEDGESTDT